MFYSKDDTFDDVSEILCNAIAEASRKITSSRSVINMDKRIAFALFGDENKYQTIRNCRAFTQMTEAQKQQMREGTAIAFVK